jgi:hypothetical protein
MSTFGTGVGIFSHRIPIRVCALRTRLHFIRHGAKVGSWTSKIEEWLLSTRTVRISTNYERDSGSVQSIQDQDINYLGSTPCHLALLTQSPFSITF